ncbi:DNA-binding response regulator [Lutibacter sp.]
MDSHLTKDSLKILILEDEFVIAQDILEILQAEGFSNIKVVNSYLQGNITISSWEPHLALCDINLLDNKTGIDFALQLKKKCPSVEVIFVTASNAIETVSKANLAFPINYIIKPFSNKQLSIAVHLALNFINSKKTKTTFLLKKLSHTEFRIIQLIAKGLSSSSISEALNISVKTVRNHRYNIAKKLDLPSQKNSLLKWAITNL